MTPKTSFNTSFNGQWIGETQGCEMPAHLWDIRQSGRRLFIQTCWEGETKTTRFYGWVREDQAAFTLGDDFTATLVDPLHFIIPGWCTNDTRGEVGPAYDVVFSRPGVAELTAQAVWRRYQAQLASAVEADEDKR